MDDRRKKATPAARSAASVAAPPVAPKRRPPARSRGAAPTSRAATAEIVPIDATGTIAPPAATPVPSFDELLGVTLPAGAPPLTLADQRAWAEIRKLQLETERARLELAALRRRERDAAADAGEARLYTFYAGVDAESVQTCMSELGQWSRRAPGAPITLLFNSPGGSVLDGLALFDFLVWLRSTGHAVRTVALGRAASMGAVLLQAGTTRVVGANAFLLIHEVTNQSNGRVSEMEDGVDFTRRLQKRLLAILATRSDLTEQQIARRWTRKEWWIDAREALDLGLVDEIL